MKTFSRALTLTGMLFLASTKYAKADLMDIYSYGGSETLLPENSVCEELEEQCRYAQQEARVLREKSDAAFAEFLYLRNKLRELEKQYAQCSRQSRCKRLQAQIERLREKLAQAEAKHREIWERLGEALVNAAKHCQEYERKCLW